MLLTRWLPLQHTRSELHKLFLDLSVYVIASSLVAYRSLYQSCKSLEAGGVFSERCFFTFDHLLRAEEIFIRHESGIRNQLICSLYPILSSVNSLSYINYLRGGN